MTVIKKYDGIAWQEVVVGESGQWNAAQTIRAETASTVLTSADAGRVIAMNSSSATAITVNGSTSFSPGQRVDFLRQGTGDVTIYGSGVTINGTPGSKLRARYSGASLLCIRPNVYVLTGDLDEAFSPLSLSPALWLDASDISTITEVAGAVSQINDKSGNSRNFTQAVGANQPATGTRAQNGLNVIDFVRGRFLDAGDILNLGVNAWSSFGVVKFDDTASSAPYGKHIFGSTDGRYGIFRDSGSLIGAYDPDVGSTGSVSAADTSTSTRYISTVLTRAGASSSHVLRISGSATTTNFTDPGTSWNTNAPWRVGRYGTSSALDLDGFIGEIVFLLRTATNDEVTSMENYLKAKWGL